MLHSTSFSASLPYKSILKDYHAKPDTSENIKRAQRPEILNVDLHNHSNLRSQSNIKQLKSNPSLEYTSEKKTINHYKENQRYIVQYSSKIKNFRIISSHQTIPELNKSVYILTVVINNFFLKKANTLQDLFADFIKDSNDN